MGVYGLVEALEACREATNCECLNIDLRAAISTVCDGADAYVEAQDGNSSKIDNVRSALTDLREEIESAQGTLSDLSDKLADIDGKLDEADCAIDELEG